MKISRRLAIKLAKMAAAAGLPLREFVERALVLATARPPDVDRFIDIIRLLYGRLNADAIAELDDSRLMRMRNRFFHGVITAYTKAAKDGLVLYIDGWHGPAIKENQ